MRRRLFCFAVCGSALVACPLADLSSGLSSGDLTDASTDGNVGDAPLGDGAANDGSLLLGDGGRFAQIAAGHGHACALDNKGALTCWGWNASGQILLSNGSPSLLPVAVPISGVSAVTVVRAAESATCALTDKQNVYCWGSNENGNLGRNSADQSDQNPASVVDGAGTPLASILLLAGTKAHFCAATTSDIYCWGRNDTAQCGVAVATDPVIAATKVQLPASSTVVDISAGDNGTCAILAIAGAPKNAIYCWGDNSEEQFGATDGPDAWVDPSPVPVPLQNAPAPTGKFISLSSGQGPICVRTDQNEAWCWGAFDGNGNSPTQLSTAVTQLAAGGDFDEAFVCFLDNTAQVNCFGSNASGEMGIGYADAATMISIPGAAISGFKASAVSSGGQFACALDPSGNTVSCWGVNHGGPQDGELGYDADGGDSYTPRAVVIP